MPDREKIIKAVDEAFEMYRSEYEGTSYFDEKEWAENKRDALALLKEQEAKLVRIDEDSVHCPSCGNELFTYPRQRFCDECGQELKWDD